MKKTDIEFLTIGTDHDITIAVAKERGNGNARHAYAILTQDGDELCNFDFQDGPISENGVNGIQNEQLLAIVADRLISFQSGPYACTENQEALRCVMDALTILTIRTELRKARGVEGKSVK